MTTEIDSNATTAEREKRVSSVPARELRRWGGWVGLVGAILMVATVGVVVAFGLPDASDPESLTDFTDIEVGRLVENTLYLAAVVLFSLQTLVLHRMLRSADPVPALFGTSVVEFGFVMMASSALLHVATSPLADLYDDPETSSGDQQTIEYAWQGAQSVFDTMLTTGLLLVPIGIVLLGVAMRTASMFGRRIALLSIALGGVGAIGAAAEVVAPDSDLSAVSVLAIVVFQVTTSWRMLSARSAPRR